jgi:hypothetical protein
MVSYINASPTDFAKTLTGKNQDFKFEVVNVEHPDHEKEKEEEEELDPEVKPSLNNTFADTEKDKMSVYSNYNVATSRKDKNFIMYYDAYKERYVI